MTTTARQKDPNPNTHPLKIVSYNISSAQPSALAHPQFRSDNAPRLIRKECLRDNPDVIALQETAFPGQGSQIFAQYTSLGTRVALHTNEYIDLLIRRESFSEYSTIPLKDLPAVAAVLTFQGTKVAVASVHLPHTKEAAPRRKQLCQLVMQSIVAQGVDDIILIGDFNMRKDEDLSTEQLAGGGWLDAWKEVTNSDKSKMFTWNGRENLYHGPDNFKFTARFDRCYARGDNLRLQEFNLIGNQPVGVAGDYLSDHYGLFVQCDVVGASSAGSTQNGVISGESTTNGTQNGNEPLNAEELRRIRLQRFEAASNPNRNEMRRTEQNMVDLTEDSDDEETQCKRSNPHKNESATNKRAR